MRFADFARIRDGVQKQIDEVQSALCQVRGSKSNWKQGIEQDVRISVKILFRRYQQLRNSLDLMDDFDIVLASAVDENTLHEIEGILREE